MAFSPCVYPRVQISLNYGDSSDWLPPPPVWPHPNLIAPAKTLFPNDVTFRDTRLRTWTHLLGATSQPTTMSDTYRGLFDECAPHRSTLLKSPVCHVLSLDPASPLKICMPKPCHFGSMQKCFPERWFGHFRLTLAEGCQPRNVAPMTGASPGTVCSLVPKVGVRGWSLWDAGGDNIAVRGHCQHHSGPHEALWKKFLLL